MLISDLPATGLRICDLATDERPREKLLGRGPAALSDAELIAILVGSGTRQHSAVDVARRLLFSIEHDLHELARLSAANLRQVPGLGPARSAKIIAAMELSRRRELRAPRKKITLASAEQCFRFLRPRIGDLNHEEFHLLCLDRGQRLLGAQRISVGGTTGTVADAKTIFRAALNYGSVTAVVLAHNHPSGRPEPSEADIFLTKKLVVAGRHLDVAVIDHVIVAGYRFYSFANDQRIEEVVETEKLVAEGGFVAGWT